MPSTRLDRDTRWIRAITAMARPFLRLFHRPEVLGLERMPPSPCLIVANHNIGAAAEVLALIDAWEKHFDRARPAYGLTHRFIFRLPGATTLFRKLGCVPANFDSADAVVATGADLLVFPGGLGEAVRPFSDRHRADMGGHVGWARIALKHGLTVVPVSITGSHSVNPVLYQSRALANVFVLPRLLGLSRYPITIGQLVYGSATTWACWGALPPWGTALAGFCAFFFTPLTPIFPMKIRLRVGEPLVVARRSGTPSSEEVRELYAKVQSRISEGVASK